MAEHWLRTAAARDLPLAKVLSMSEEQAYRWFYRARWGDGEPSCVHCGVVDAYRLRRNGKRINRFKCRDCGREFTVTLQTIFADRKLSFRKMLAIIALHVHSVKDKAALQDCREVGVCYPSAWVMLMKIREAVADSEPQELLDDVVEIDGAYVGGYQRCQSASKRDPLSARKRDPFRGDAGTILPRATTSASVPAEASRWDDCLEFSEIEVADRLQRLGEGAVLQVLR
jgi:transposase-like protein